MKRNRACGRRCRIATGAVGVTVTFLAALLAYYILSGKSVRKSDATKSRLVASERQATSDATTRIEQANRTPAGVEVGDPTALASLPGLQDRRVERTLVDVLDKVDSQRDKWPVEVFNDEVAVQLTTLSQIMLAEGAQPKGRLREPFISIQIVGRTYRFP